jgi:Leucine-rich repeat (LRR) protein|tara:strand:- start:176 stop:739 length:564 start_codon:yes stop_codon:yes gene_type:complete
MKRIVLLLVTLVLLVGATMPACSDATVTFPDWNLESAIRKTIDKRKGPIFVSDLKSLTILEVQEKGISDLAGLEHLTNLRWLVLVENNINDISPLAGLIKLEMLALVNNKISDLSPLIDLANLQELFLTNNNISDIYPLVTNRGLSIGDTVNLWNNPLSTTSVNVYIPQLEERGINVEQTAPPIESN